MQKGRAFPPQPPEAGAPPPRKETLRQRLGRFYTRARSPLLVLVSIIVTLSAVYAYDSTRPPPQRLTQRDIDAAVERTLKSIKPAPYFASQVYEIIRPSLVRVETMVAGAEGEEPGAALGSGVVITDSGVILTSLHVVRDAAEIRVIFSDGSESEAWMIMGQPENDLAVLQAAIIPDDLLPATLAPSTTLRVGDEVVAVGNPFGISNSLSSGVVSGLGRNYKSPRTGQIMTDLVQFDAAVNPGNSGGPLINRDGEVVGIVTALLNPTDDDVFIGIGFAVPIETAAGGAGAPPL
ncbi:MAG: trypsin-like peptidase domain-containing protein [Chloroflexi bacterium]|nr:trypsin-like peptidase domain-containing protein [Chloroflexota bacterium]